MLFANDFAGISDSKENLQKLMDVVYSYCSKWRLRGNVRNTPFTLDSIYNTIRQTTRLPKLVTGSR